jgi:regulator of protease activity HflC (stomatin/prohibitin superfamily)
MFHLERVKTMDEVIISLFIIFGLVIIVMIPNIKIVSKNRAIVVERLGQYLKTLDQPGIYFLTPLLDRAIETVPLDEMNQTLHFNHEDEIININYQLIIFDVKLFVYGELSSLTSLKEYITESYLKYRKDLTFFNEDVKAYAASIGINLINMQIE